MMKKKRVNIKKVDKTINSHGCVLSLSYIGLRKGTLHPSFLGFEGYALIGVKRPKDGRK